MTAERGEAHKLPDHVFDVLGFIISAPHNRTQLFGDVITGVSRWAVRNRITTEEVTFLREAFDRINLKIIRGAASQHKVGMKSNHIGFLIDAEMEDVLKELRA